MGNSFDQIIWFFPNPFDEDIEPKEKEKGKKTKQKSVVAKGLIKVTMKKSNKHSTNSTGWTIEARKM